MKSTQCQIQIFTVHIPWSYALYFDYPCLLKINYLFDSFTSSGEKKNRKNPFLLLKARPIRAIKYVICSIEIYYSEKKNVFFAHNVHTPHSPSPTPSLCLSLSRTHQRTSFFLSLGVHYD